MSDERPEGLDWPDPEPPAKEPGGQAPPEQDPAPDEVEGAATVGDTAPAADAPQEGAVALLGRDLIVPIRSSSGRSPDPGEVTLDGMRHGTDEQGRFLAAFSSPDAFDQLGPPASDRVILGGRELLELAERAGERVIVDPGWNGRLTLELANVSRLPITLYHGMRICQVSFQRLSTPSERPYGSEGLSSRYQGQDAPTASRAHLDFDFHLKRSPGESGSK